ncbi:MAG: hypothetical protein V2I33_18790 [Kangiellaceae bacterium]|jgi:hypothetical protein|nr:hypothetical protein [Kangiellaceae bacterium]
MDSVCGNPYSQFSVAVGSSQLARNRSDAVGSRQLAVDNEQLLIFQYISDQLSYHIAVIKILHTDHSLLSSEFGDVLINLDF